MDSSKTFRDELAIQYPTLGRGLWDPDPGGLYSAVQVGDVGFIRHGYFTRLFNALSPHDHPSDHSPESDPQFPHYLQRLQPRTSNHIRTSIDHRKDFRSKNVTNASLGPNIGALGPDDDTQVSFSCSGKQGALLYLPFPAEREDTIALGDFGKWIIKNIYDCMRLVEERGLGVNRMEDIILVTGRHLARSWVRAVFSEIRGGTETSFIARVSGDSVVHLEERNVSGAQLEFGPNGENLAENQCIFVRGYHVVRMLNIWPRLRGLAGPASLPEPEPESDTHLQLMGVPGDDDYRDPLYTLLEYIAEQNPSCDAVLVHDDDLKCIENTIPPLETLQPDTLIGSLRDSAPKTCQFQCESFSRNENGSEAELTIATVATLSLNVFGKPHDERTISSSILTSKTTSGEHEGPSEELDKLPPPSTATPAPSTIVPLSTPSTSLPPQVALPQTGLALQAMSIFGPGTESDEANCQTEDSVGYKHRRRGIGSSNEVYPATKVIKYLIDAVDGDVMSFRPHAQVSYLLVDRSRDLFDAINVYIQRTESEEDLGSFDIFIRAIDLIKEALSTLIAYTEDERARHRISGTTVEDCMASTEVWAANREGLWNALDSLESRPELTDLLYGLEATSSLEDRNEARRHDDKSFLEEIVAGIKDAFKTQRRIPSTISNVNANLNQLLDKMTKGSILPWVAVFSVKTALLVQCIANISLRHTQIDRVTRNHLRSRSVWEAAEQLTNLLNSTLGDDKATINQVRSKYDTFVMLLFKTTELSLPMSYLEMIKLVGRVRRPFQAQALAIVMLCRTLANVFNEESHHTAENMLPLEDACDEALKAAQAVIVAATELKGYDITKFEDHPASKAINKAKEQIKTCFDTFGLGDTWSEKETLLSVAVEKDKKRAEDFIRTCTAERAASIRVTVAVYCQDDTHERPVIADKQTVEVEGSIRLSAIRWSVSGILNEQLARSARQTGQFFLSPGNEPCELHSRVSELAGSSKDLSLLLVFRV